MTKTLTGGSFQSAAGTVIASGKLILTLSQDAMILAGGQVKSSIPVVINLDANGDVVGTPVVYGNDELSPSGTLYYVDVIDSGGNTIREQEKWVLTGTSPINLDTIVPTLLNPDPGFANPVLQNPTAAQTITGQGLTFTSSVPFTTQGTGTHSGTETFTGTIKADAFGLLDARNFGVVADGVTDDSSAINSAITSASSATVGASKVVLLPPGICIINSQIVVKQKVILRGSDNGTSIQAGASFPVSTALVVIGNTAQNDQTRLERVIVDGNNISGSIGISTTTGNEMSGADQVGVRRCMNFGIDIETGSENSMWTNLNIVNSATAPATAEGIRVNTNVAVKTYISNVTIIPGGGGQQTAGIHDISGVVMAYGIHCENYVDGIRFDSGVNASVYGYTGSSDVTNAIKLNAGVGSIFLAGIEKNGGTNAINDVDRGIIITDNVVGFYSYNHVAPTRVISSSTGAPFISADTLQIKRVRANQGTANVAGDFALSAGWGTTGAISAITGTDQGAQFTITPGGTGIAANPTVTLTFKDGTWTNSPILATTRGDTNTPTTGFWSVTSVTATQAVFTFVGLPVTGTAYIMAFVAMGR